MLCNWVEDFISTDEAQAAHCNVPLVCITVTSRMSKAATKARCHVEVVSLVPDMCCEALQVPNLLFAAASQAGGCGLQTREIGSAL